jgi:dTDP-4-amino-4,6-dideoxygalactose transaminase
MFYLRFRSKLVRDSFIAHMRERNISVVFHYQALNASPFAAKFGALRGQCPEAEAASDDLVRLPMFGDISDYEIDAVVEACCAFAQF